MKSCVLESKFYEAGTRKMKKELEWCSTRSKPN